MWNLKLPTKKVPLILNERHLNNFLASDIGTSAAVYWKLKNYVWKIRRKPLATRAQMFFYITGNPVVLASNDLLTLFLFVTGKSIGLTSWGPGKDCWVVLVLRFLIVAVIIYNLVLYYFYFHQKSKIKKHVCVLLLCLFLW